MQVPGWTPQHRQAWQKVRDHRHAHDAVRAVCAALESEKFPPFPWRNILNTHTTNRLFTMGGGTQSIQKSMSVHREQGGFIATLRFDNAIYCDDGLPLQVSSSWPLAAQKDAEALACKLCLGWLLVMAVERIAMPFKAFRRGHASMDDIWRYAGRWHTFLCGEGPEPAAFAAGPGQLAPGQPPPPATPPPQPAAPPRQPPPPATPPPQPAAPPPPAATAAPPAVAKRPPPRLPPSGIPQQPSRAPPQIPCEICGRPLAAHGGIGDFLGSLPMPSCQVCGCVPSYHAPHCCPWAQRRSVAQRREEQEDHQAAQAAIGAVQQQFLLQQQAAWQHQQQVWLREQQQQVWQAQQLHQQRLLQQQEMQQQAQQEHWQQMQQQMQQQQVQLEDMRLAMSRNAEPRRVESGFLADPVRVDDVLPPTRPNSPSRAPVAVVAAFPTVGVLPAAIGAQELLPSMMSMPQLPVGPPLGSTPLLPSATAPVLRGTADPAAAAADGSHGEAGPAAAAAEAPPMAAVGAQTLLASTMPQLPVGQPLGSAPVLPPATAPILSSSSSCDAAAAAAPAAAMPMPMLAAMSATPPMTEMVVPKAAGAVPPIHSAGALSEGMAENFVLISPSWGESGSASSEAPAQPFPWPAAYTPRD